MAQRKPSISDGCGVNPGPPERGALRGLRALQVGSLQSHKLKCKKHMASDLIDVKAQWAELG